MQGKFACWMKGLALGIGLMVAGNAQAGFTTIKEHPITEVGPQEMFEHQYDGDWHRVGDDFYCGNMSAKRIDDSLSLPGMMDVKSGKCGYDSDEFWCGGKVTITAVAKFSMNTQSLAAIDMHGHKAGQMNVTGYGFNIDPLQVTCDMHGQEFEWQRSGDSGTQSSVDSENSDLRDHMITYVIEGLPGVTTPVWMMMWEDLNRTQTLSLKRTWADYNDLVVEVRPAVTSIPLPPAGWAGLFTLGGTALIRGRKRLASVLA